jgi:exopolysaccharide biosynthesis WecB/TagA/CpsF family protein
MIGGLPVAVLDRQRTARLMIEAALARRGQRQPCLFFTTANGQVVSACGADPQVRRLFEKADLISPDGMSVVFASRLGRGRRLPERVATTDAFHDAAAVAVERGARFFFLGAEEAVSAKVVEAVRRLYPGLAVVGRRNGYFSEADESGIVEDINAAAPDVLWVGMGVPRQQKFIARNLARLDRVGVAKSCGGLFDFLAGVNRRAPGWMQASGLEWLHRMLSDPRRFAVRYLTTNPHALMLLVTRSRGEAAEGTIEAVAAGGLH